MTTDAAFPDDESAFRRGGMEGGQVAILCASGCGRPVPKQAVRRGGPKRFCSDRCRRSHWNRQHPRQTLLFEARPVPLRSEPQRELLGALAKRETDWRRVLERLQRGPASTLDLLAITHRFSARLHEHKHSHPWRKDKGEKGGFVYSLEAR